MYFEDAYRESFLDVCKDGIAPMWAVKQIFEEHQSDLAEYQAAHTTDWQHGETILEWIGY